MGKEISTFSPALEKLRNFLGTKKIDLSLKLWMRRQLGLDNIATYEFPLRESGTSKLLAFYSKGRKGDREAKIVLMSEGILEEEDKKIWLYFKDRERVVVASYNHGVVDSVWVTIDPEEEGRIRDEIQNLFQLALGSPLRIVGLRKNVTPNIAMGMIRSIFRNDIGREDGSSFLKVYGDLSREESEGQLVGEYRYFPEMLIEKGSKEGDLWYMGIRQVASFGKGLPFISTTVPPRLFEAQSS